MNKERYSEKEALMDVIKQREHQIDNLEDEKRTIIMTHMDETRELRQNIDDLNLQKNSEAE